MPPPELKTFQPRVTEADKRTNVGTKSRALSSSSQISSSSLRNVATPAIDVNRMASSEPLDRAQALRPAATA